MLMGFWVLILEGVVGFRGETLDRMQDASMRGSGHRGCIVWERHIVNTCDASEKGFAVIMEGVGK